MRAVISEIIKLQYREEMCLGNYNGDRTWSSWWVAEQDGTHHSLNYTILQINCSFPHIPDDSLGFSLGNSKLSKAENKGLAYILLELLSIKPLPNLDFLFGEEIFDLEQQQCLLHREVVRSSHFPMSAETKLAGLSLSAWGLPKWGSEL
jgi:hypothetical protein